jgi:hypothetical protein
MQTCVGDLYSYLTSILEGGKLPFSRLDCFNPGKELVCTLNKWFGGSRRRYESFGKELNLLPRRDLNPNFVTARNLVIVLDTILFNKHEFMFEDLNYF